MASWGDSAKKIIPENQDSRDEKVRMRESSSYWRQNTIDILTGHDKIWWHNLQELRGNQFSTISRGKTYTFNQNLTSILKNTGLPHSEITVSDQTLT